MMVVKCAFKTCLYYNKGKCNRMCIELISFDYVDEKNEDIQGLSCKGFKYNSSWMYQE
ncbi:DUF1540 domain-containing protein [Clostridium chromiireducens]|uniref:DUF1540 domain-containing protein n=2 Tax=Clostridium chromiireducens TaxID=225345 RepID=A0A1V4IFT8_9CLOT|nr:DUF1540 domain-containing protein [Clostridium chromiireducens]OPJ58525.1 hypothetical protein CLCHR_38850 [Clostridium chromiireducens]